MLLQRYKLGRQSFHFPVPPVILSWASAAGKKEGQGPLGRSFDAICQDPFLGEKTWEQGEQAMQKMVLRRALRKAELTEEKLSVVFSGDLLNQCTASSFPLKNTGIPHIGLYGACSTMAESLLLGAMAVGGGFAEVAGSVSSSHFCGTERQYRFPLGYGGQRTPTSQWTVTGAGAALIGNRGSGPRITGCTIGTVRDLGIRDANNMGAAMAPAALRTVLDHFRDFGTGPEDYDLIVTGDLGQLGKELLLELALKEGVQLGGKLSDCGSMIFDNTRQNVGCGGSGAGCSACVLCGHLLGQLSRGQLQKILFCGTGALLSPLTSQQKLPIPGICHAVVLEAPEEERKAP